jgi:hypothetical protein
MKKAISLSFLLLANIILLAHAAVPHHHHENAGVCFVNTHCEDNEETHHHDSQTNEHERNNFPDRCCFDIAYTHAGNSTKPACRLYKKCDCEQLLFSLISNNLNAQSLIDNVGLPFRQNPFVLLFYSEFISYSGGLRAPPAC